MRVTLTYTDFKARLLAGIAVYYINATGSFIARYNSNNVTCEYVDVAMPATFSTDFIGATLVQSFGEA